MAIDGEPKNGDFVRYIETLNRQAGGSPGQVLPRQRSAKPAAGKTAVTQADAQPSIYTYTRQSEPATTAYSSDSETAAASYSYAQTTDTSAGSRDRNASPGATRNSGDEGRTTLAARSGQRHLALGLGIAGAVALWNAAHRLLTAINTNSLDFDSMVPIVFLLICAGMLFKGARGVRQKQNKPLAKLPPLTTIHMGRKTPK